MLVGAGLRPSQTAQPLEPAADERDATQDPLDNVSGDVGPVLLGAACAMTLLQVATCQAAATSAAALASRPGYEGVDAPALSCDAASASSGQPATETTRSKSGKRRHSRRRTAAQQAQAPPAAAGKEEHAEALQTEFEMAATKACAGRRQPRSKSSGRHRTTGTEPHHREFAALKGLSAHSATAAPPAGISEDFAKALEAEFEVAVRTALGMPASDSAQAASPVQSAFEAPRQRHRNRSIDKPRGVDVAWRKRVAESWAEVRSLAPGDGNSANQITPDGRPGQGRPSDGLAQAKGPRSSSQQRRGFGAFRWIGRGPDVKEKEEEDAEQIKEDRQDRNGRPSDFSSGKQLPRTFEDMGLMNAGIFGANVSWIRVVLSSFDPLVVSVVNDDEPRLTKDTRILALRIWKEAVGKVDLGEFRIVMLASLRSLLPKQWDLELEKAWENLWETVMQEVSQTLQLIPKYHRPIEGLVSNLSNNEKRQLGLATFRRLFEQHPRSENHFKQSNERLCVIVRRALEFSAELFQDPLRTVGDITALGLKHIMYGIPTRYFAPFVECLVEEVHRRGADPSALQGLRWTLETVATIMTHTIEDGSNPLLRAVIKNNPKEVKRELGKLPKNRRAAAALGAAVD